MPERVVRRYNRNTRLPNSLLEQILQIHDSVVISRSDVPPANGFLISRLTSCELDELLRADATDVYIASTAEHMEGFCLVTHVHDLLDLCKDPAAGELHYTQPTSIAEADYLFQIAVMEQNSRAGIGSALVNVVKADHPNGLVADVLVEPVKNNASLAFFAKHGFETIGELHLARYRDFGKLVSNVLLWQP